MDCTRRAQIFPQVLQKKPRLAVRLAAILTGRNSIVLMSYTLVDEGCWAIKRVLGKGKSISALLNVGIKYLQYYPWFACCNYM